MSDLPEIKEGDKVQISVMTRFQEVGTVIALLGEFEKETYEIQFPDGESLRYQRSEFSKFYKFKNLLSVDHIVLGVSYKDGAVIRQTASFNMGIEGLEIHPDKWIDVSSEPAIINNGLYSMAQSFFMFVCSKDEFQELTAK